MDHIKYLKSLYACGEAIKFASNFDSLQEAWKNCNRGDWLLWFIGKTCEQNSHEHKKLVYLACQCARLALQYIPKGEERPRIAIETTEAWTRDKTSIEDVRIAADAAYTAANAITYTTTITTTAAAAAYAAAYATLTVIYPATYAAYAAGYAADACAGMFTAYADTNKMLKECAEIVRREVPNINEWLQQ